MNVPETIFPVERSIVETTIHIRQWVHTKRARIIIIHVARMNMNVKFEIIFFSFKIVLIFSYEHSYFNHLIWRKKFTLN